MNTTSLPGWLQVTLVGLCGVVGWLLLRPYRRITQLGGRDSARQIAATGGWHRRFFRDLRDAATLGVATPVVESAIERRRGMPIAEPGSLRPEARAEDPFEARGTGSRPEERRLSEESTDSLPQRRRTPRWTAAEDYDGAPNYAIYRPDASRSAASSAQRPESATIRG